MDVLDTFKFANVQVKHSRDMDHKKNSHYLFINMLQNHNG